MSSWSESKRNFESGRFLRELLSLPTAKSKRAYVAQYNPFHYILTTQGG